jgi:hypothetical protein
MPPFSAHGRRTVNTAARAPPGPTTGHTTEWARDHLCSESRRDEARRVLGGYGQRTRPYVLAPHTMASPVPAENVVRDPLLFPWAPV